MNNSTIRNILVVAAVTLIAVSALMVVPQSDADKGAVDNSEPVVIYSMVLDYAFRGERVTEIPIWDFGDGTEEVQAWSGSHKYAEPGVYTVTQTVENNIDTISESWEVHIMDYPVVTFDFGIEGMDDFIVEQSMAGVVLEDVPEIPVRDGYTFDGWFKDDGTEFDVENDEVTETMTLHAKWTATSSPGGDDSQDGDGTGDDGEGTDWLAIGLIIIGIIITIGAAVLFMPAAIIGIIVVIVGIAKFAGVF